MLNLKEIKDGMRIVVNSNNNSGYIKVGEKGIVRVDSVDGPYIVFDEYGKDRHDCDGHCKNGYGYWLMDYNAMYFDIIQEIEFKAGDKVVVTRENFIDEGKMTYDDFLNCEIGKKQAKNGYLVVDNIYSNRVYIYGTDKNYRFKPEELTPYVESKTTLTPNVHSNNTIKPNQIITYIGGLLNVPFKDGTKFKVITSDATLVKLAVLEHPNVTLHIAKADVLKAFKTSGEWSKWAIYDKDKNCVWRVKDNHIQVKRAGKESIGDARCMECDIFDLNTGLEIAYTRLLIKEYTIEIKKLSDKLSMLSRAGDNLR